MFEQRAANRIAVAAFAGIGNMAVTNRANLSSVEMASIEKEVADHRSLEQVLRWGLSQPAGARLPQVIADVIVQDEYSHDVIVPWRAGLVLVYGAT